MITRFHWVGECQPVSSRLRSLKRRSNCRLKAKLHWDQWNIAWQFGRPELPAEPLVLPPAPWEDIQQGAAIRTPSSLAAEGTR